MRGKFRNWKSHPEAIELFNKPKRQRSELQAKSVLLILRKLLGKKVSFDAEKRKF